MIPEEDIDQNMTPPEPTVVESQAPPTEPELPSGWEGRLRKEQEMTDIALAPYHMRLDRNTGQLVPTNPQAPVYPTTTYQEPVAPSEPEEFNYDNLPGEIDRRAEKKAQEIVERTLTKLMPLLDNLTASTVGSQYDDWKDISGAVTQKLSSMFGMTLATAQAINPALVEEMIFAERGRRATASPPQSAQAPGATPQVLAVEAARQAAVSAAAGVGSAASSTPATAKTYGLDEEEQQAAERMGISYEEYASLLEQPAKPKKQESK